MPDVLQIGESVQLTPDQIAQATPQVTPEVTPQVADPFPVGSQISLGPEQAAEARRQSGQLDPLQDFTAEQLAELQTQNPEFNLIQSYAPKTELQQRPGMHQKVADAYNLLRQKGTFGAQLDVKKVPGQLVDIAKGFGKQLWNYAQAFATPVGAMVADVAGADPATVSGMFAQGQRQIAENISGTEAGLAGLGHTTSAGLNWINRRLKLSKPLAELSPEERVANLQDAIHSAKQIQEISRGKGPIMSTVGDEVVKELETAGVPVRPEQVQELAAGDPFSWFLMGKAFHGLGAVVPPSVSAQAAKATQAAGNFAAKFGGKTIETAADVTKLGLDAAAAVSPVAGAITGAVKGGTLHGPVGLATGAALGYKGGQVIAGGLTKAGKTAERVSGIGEQIAGTKPIISPVAQIGKDVLQSAPAAAGDLAKGVGFDLALAGLTSEEAPEERAGLGIGAAFGVLGAGKRVGGRVLSGQIIAPREYGVNQVTPSSGQFPALDAMHTAAIQGAGPGIAARLNAIRLFAKGAAPGTDVFLAKDSPSMEAALTQVGMSPEQAKAYAAQQGFFTTSLPGRDGSTRKVIVARDVSAAPHEAFHAIQDVLGENENLAIDKIVQDAYAPRWEAEGETYARRLVGNEGIRTKTWREAILDASGWGRAEAADKLAMDAANRIRTATGAEPKAADVKAMAEGEWASMLADAAKRNPGMPVEELQTSLWRDILNPQEAQEVGDRYLARELAAENFDAVFKHGVGGDAGVIQKLSRVVANAVSVLGGEPLAGRVSETGQVPLSYDVTQAVREARPVVVEPAKPKGPKPVIASTQGMPATPEAQQQAAAEARQIAAEAPAAAPAPAPTPGVTPGIPATGATAPFVSKSPRELLGAIAEAIAARAGVKINYSSAPGEPAAALTSTRPIRRSIIEAFRTMPESARALWEKSFFPERVIKTKSGYQVLGWAPEVFAANAHKTAQTMIDLGIASPYELNPAKRSFSDKGWQDLFNDVTVFVKNQGAGRTGAGEALVVPKGVSDQGFFAPPTTGKGMPLDQRNADFINMMFNFKLPDTPRITSGKLPLNIAGQEISAATQPGRVESPVQPKQPYGGEAAQKLGIEGREILEVNPLRREIEAAAAAKNIPMPALIEAVQRLNLEHIKEVQVAELQQFRGNTLTLTAGFQPNASPKGVKQAAIRDENGKIYEGESHAHATFAALQERRPTQKNQNAMDAVLRHPWSTEGFVTNEGEFLNRQEAMRRAVEMNQYTPTPNEAQLLADPASRLQPGLESTSFAHQQRLAEAGYPRDASQPRFSDLQSQFSPAIEGVEKLKDKTFWDGLKTFTGKYGGGITGYAYEIGSAAKSEADLSAFRSAYDTYGTMGKEAMRNKDYNTASDLLSKAQVAREAFEVATGQKIDGTAGEAGSLKQLRAKDPSYTPLLSRAPEPAQFQPNPKNPAAEELAKDYAKEKGFEPPVPSTNRQLPSKLMQELGDYFEDAPHAPADPATKASYGAMLSQMKDQADKILESGIDVEPWTGKGEPYPNSRAMTDDVMRNKHLYFLKTTGGFGGAPAGGENLSPENLMRAPSGISRHGYDLDMNEVTRFVHDYFGHTAEGNQFGPRGEFNAFLKHAQLFTPEAQKALTAELLMQAGWFFNGRHIRREDGTVPVKGEPDYIPPENRPFIEPKNLLPSEELFQRVQDEVNAVRGQFQPLKDEGPSIGERATAFGGTNFKSWMNPSGNVIPLTDRARTHEGLAQDILGGENSGSGENSANLYKKGWLRITPYGGNSLMANTVAGRPISPKQKSELINQAIEQGFEKVYYDNGNTYKMIWENDPLSGQFAPPQNQRDRERLAIGGVTQIQRDRAVEEPRAEGFVPGQFTPKKDKEGPVPGTPEWENRFKDPRERLLLGDPYPMTPEARRWWKNADEAAVKTPDGEVHTGRTHIEAEQSAIDSGYDSNTEFTRGYVDHSNKYFPMPPGVSFQPKRADKEFKLKPASAGFSKAWIFPDGTPVQIGGTWHNQWLDDNATVRKQFGFTTPTGSADKDIRTEALQKGFARINYDSKTGTLTVEAREKDWPEIAPAFEKIMQANLPQIDKVQVYQYNDKVDAISDSGFANLFSLPTKKAKLAAVPFLNAPGEVTELSPQATPGALSEQAAPGALPARRTSFQPFPAKEFEKEIEQIREGALFGQTFEPSGKVWSPSDKSVDIVSLASVNVPQSELTPQAFRSALAPYAELLKNIGIVAGAFSFTQDGKPMVSIDLNAVVPQKFRENTLEFAKANDQVSIWDAAAGEAIPSGGTGATKLIAPQDLLKAYGQLILGKPAMPSKETAREQLFAGLGEPTKEPLSPKATADMTKAQLAAYYPEAVIAKKKGEYISSNILESPLYKSAKTEDAAVESFAQKLVDYAKENESKPEFQLGKRWYREFVPKLKKEFGPDAQIFVELLAATSPQTSVSTNFGYAYDALQGLKSGRFKKIIPKFEEGLAKIADGSWESWFASEAAAGNVEVPQTGAKPPTFLAHWINKHDLKPRQSNGKLYGIHSVPVLQVFARHWVDSNTGPKTRNFVSNLLGTGHDATIDIWADRTMRRLGYEGFNPRWRILPQNAAPTIDKDFYFAQKVFKKAAAQLKIKPDDLQGGIWFAEKQKWADNGWGRLDLGSFQNEMAKIPAIKARIEENLTSEPPLTTESLPFTVESRKLKK